MNKLLSLLRRNSLYLAWAVALGATIVSLYLSEVRGFAPCVLCWYQRILMYPLVLIIPVGILKKDRHLTAYIKPFVIAGALLALYHSLLQWGIFTEKLAPCQAALPCTTKYVELFGWMTIPFGSFVSFVVIGVLVILSERRGK